MAKIKFTLAWKKGEDLTLTSEKERDNGKNITKKTVIETKEQVERRRWLEMLGLYKSKKPTYH